MNRAWALPVACSILFFAGGVFVSGQAEQAPPDAAKLSPAHAKLAAAQELFKLQQRRHAAGLQGDGDGAEAYHTWSIRLMEAERDVAAAAGGADRDAAVRRAAQQHLDRMAARSKRIEDLYKAGHAMFDDVLTYRYFVAEAQQWLESTAAKP